MRAKRKGWGTGVANDPTLPIGGAADPGDARAMIRWCYRLFLDREPESDAAVDQLLALAGDPRALRNVLFSSEEFRENNQVRFGPTLNGDEPPLAVDAEASETDLGALFERVQQSWQKLGETEPYWSVVTQNQYAADNIGQAGARDALHATGRDDRDRVIATLARNGIQLESLRTCLEYGCGLGRVTRWLAERFERVEGFDISRAHLDVAEAYLQSENVQNVTLHHVTRVTDVARLPSSDFIFTSIVLQHNPPPVIAYTLDKLMRALNPGGVALFQIPTYRMGYIFSLGEYLSNALEPGGMEMHFLPQRHIFSIVRAAGAQVLEVLEDDRIGMGHRDVSNTFLVRRD